jgi:hypothetical protein
MLLGRQALRSHLHRQPTDRLLQPELSYDVYPPPQVRKAAPQPRAAHRRAQPRGQLLHPPPRREGEARGHSVEVIDTTRCYMAINALAPEVHYDGKRLPRYDAVIPRIGASITALWHRRDPPVRNHRHLLRQRLRGHHRQPRQAARPPDAGAPQDRHAEHRLRRLAQGHRQPDRAGGHRAADREAAGIDARQGRGAGRDQEGRRIGDRRLSRAQGQFPRAGFRQGGRGRGHPLPRDRRQGRGRDETHGAEGDFRSNLHRAARRSGAHHQGRRTRGRRARGQGLFGLNLAGWTCCAPRRAQGARGQFLARLRRHRTATGKNPNAPAAPR